jgi:AAA15 family ATPase/GTPase
MLLEFSVANYRSIAEKQTLSLVAGGGSTHAARNVVNIDGDQNRYLRSAVIYGPNAAGKSNLPCSTWF